jgi:RimJ/RimL family protein N-acetyltransferase
MPATTPGDAGHPLLARTPIAAGAVGLRGLRVDNLDDFLGCRGDPEVARYQGWQPMDHEASRDFLQNAAPPPWRDGDWAQIGIARTDDDRLVGDIGLLREGLAQVQLGFSLARGAQGRGWAVAALRACIGELLVPLGMTRLRGITDERNAASVRLLSRQGFVPTLREEVLFRDERCTEITLERRL